MSMDIAARPEIERMKVLERDETALPQQVDTPGNGRSGWVDGDGGGGRHPQGPGPSGPTSRHRHRWSVPASVLLMISLAMGAVSHGYQLFSYPLYITDEGIYLQQAWAVLRQARLSPYTYFYDHAPAGWLVIAAWIDLLPLQFQTFGNAINSGRALMLLVHLANVFFLFHLTHRLSGNRAAAFLTCFFFNLSPLAVFYQRMVLLDNLMVLWVLVSLYLATSEDRRVVTPMFSGLALGVAVLTKENAVFFAPIIGYLLYSRTRRNHNWRFALGFWSFAGAAVISLYFLYAALKNELFPTGLSFDLNNPPADHVSLLYTIWWQLHRSQGSILDPNSLFWEFSLRRWLPKDAFILSAGLVSMLVNFFLGRRTKNTGYVVASLLAAAYAFYLVRGSMMLEFYVVPLLPFLAMNLGMLVARLLHLLPDLLRPVAFVAFLGVFLLHPTWGYVLVIDEFGKVVAHDLYKLPLTYLQTQQLEFIRRNIPPDAMIIMDDDIWVDLHDVRPFYKRAHSHWKASADPDVRDKLFAKNWRNVDYIVMSNKMRIAMEQNNSDGREDWILEALDHAQRIWVAERGDIQLEIYKVQK